MQIMNQTNKWVINENIGTDLFLSYNFEFRYPYTQPIYPVVSVLFYIFTVWFFSPSENIKKGQSAKSKSKSSSNTTLTPLKIFSVVHNLVLCIFSLIVFVAVFPEIYGKVTTDWQTFTCSKMSDSEMYWSYLFYLSKIWEFIDTWIIIYKRRRPSTLQVYHHIGAVFACWLQVIVGGKSFWVFVCFNSFIHTIMYFYYCCSTLGYRFKYKFVITILQLSQFVLGQSLGFYQYIVYGTDCYRTNDFYVYLFNVVYVWPLVLLFAHFYRNAYLKKKKQHKTH